MGRKRLGEILLARGLLRPDALEGALTHGRNRGLRLGAAVVDLGLVPEERLTEALAEALALPHVGPELETPDWGAIHLLRPAFCEAHDLFPYALEEGRTHKIVRVAMADPLDVPAIDEIEFTTGHRVRPALASRGAVRAAIRRWVRRERPPAEASGDDGRMMIVRPGGVQEVVDTGPADDLDDVVPLVEEIEPAATAAAPPSPAIPPPPEPPAVRADDARFGEPRAPFAPFDRMAPPGAPRSGSPGRRGGSRALPLERPALRAARDDDLAFLTGDASAEARLHRLERRFTAVLRLLGERGVLRREDLRLLD